MNYPVVLEDLYFCCELPCNFRRSKFHHLCYVYLNNVMAYSDVRKKDGHGGILDRVLIWYHGTRYVVVLWLESPAYMRETWV